MTKGTRMSAEVERQVTRRFRRTSQDLAGARAGLRGMRGDVLDGAGEFGTLIDDASRDFQASWRAVLDVYADSAALIAGNTNAQYVDLLKIDDGAGT